MAAGAMVYLRGGSAYQIAQAAAMALKNLLGLVCDPVSYTHLRVLSLPEPLREDWRV